MDLIKFIKIDENSRVPKYQQIIDSIIDNISLGNLTMDQKIPSINMFSEEFYLSRDTVEKAYSILKKRNIITSIRGKGYYISRTKLISKVNILFLINKLSSYKLRTYNHFIDAIGGNSHTDLHIYHCDESLFLNLLDKNKSAYDYFVIMPHFKTEDLKHISLTDNVTKALKKIPEDKLVILDNKKPNINGSSVEIYQDFENDIYFALKEALPKIKKYKKIMLIYPEKAVYPYPRRILHGFRKFCVEHKLDFEILEKVYDDMILKKGDLFITIEEADLVNLVKQVREDEFRLGSDIGIISYNDTPLKELLGITVISTDFKVMGETAATMILNKQKGKVKVPFNFIDRDSL
ncbi:GntR family transcriptional regulator [Algibacter amylolyticus]|uniref:GntR family transcriptional regulator n=1 Tax=Algibacter amylolyticus TaxID=1608400 RepID=A0A5M7B676_9FLAO|nr:GntR family transcriptional regulator [Algibacter amylolyticus]KAA5824819.1 GntR family transcriptional regulator [Algibacter amylolyticus]MBB5268940.1 DNA-binding transcriptional regulator YhcF (GntR family) [Algibacter amylolyticus]TSJ75984.1 GntR family transcriptional regulator [Algibacter amylolyticus]